MEAIRNHPYDIPNVRIEWVNKDFGVPLGFWRSVGPSQNGFIVESFVDELAARGGEGPRRVPPGAPRQVAAPQGACSSCSPARRTGARRCRRAGAAASRSASRTAATRRTTPRSRSADDGTADGPPDRLRHRLRHRRQPRPGEGPDGRGHGLRAHRDALRRDHPRPGARPADELPHVPDAPHGPDAAHRGPHPGLRRGAGRSRRARRRRRSRRPCATRSSRRPASACVGCRSAPTT